jgi:hypothetical protein
MICKTAALVRILPFDLVIAVRDAEPEATSLVAPREIFLEVESFVLDVIDSGSGYNAANCLLRLPPARIIEDRHQTGAPGSLNMQRITVMRGWEFSSSSVPI